MEIYKCLIGKMKGINQIILYSNCYMKKDGVAIIYKNERITYEQFIIHVSYCIGELRKRKIVNGVVGIMLSRTPEYIYWIIAILASGYAFVPIGAKDDEEKRKYIITNSNMDFYITDDDYKDLNWDEQAEFNFELPDLDFETILADKNKLAYIMYTSGTTGLPKGVMISRGALKKFITYFLDNKIKKDDIVLANTTFTFDISLLEIVLSLARGATIFLTSDIEQKNPKTMVNILKNNIFDWVQFTPSYISMLIGYAQSVHIFDNVKNLIIGGEKITKTLASFLKEKTQCNLYNAYGPTEATIWTHIGNLRDSFVNVGNPINCVDEYILDSYGNEANEGMLWLGGDTIALGYVNNNELTEKKFKQHKGHVIYETGDLVCKKDGKLVILGRTDNQVKIFGRRIELEEIECKIVECIGLLQCLVLYREGDLVLCVDNQKLILDEVRKLLINKLDTVFIPRKIFYLEKYPLLTNGKINRKKVEEMYMEQYNIQEKVLGVMKEFVIGNFDNESKIEELGISSLDYIALIVKMEKVFNMEFDEYALTISYFKTVEDLVAYVHDKSK